MATYPNTPVNSINKYFVCSEHFTIDDYFEKMQVATRTMKRVLKDTAIPSIIKTGQIGSPVAAVSVPLCFEMTNISHTVTVPC